ncbi:MAG: LacI family DNA-binding transcriptional regulator [Spirochaetales bacterium]
MSKRVVSAVDVANAAGVSRTTVSFVLNNTPGKSISESTRQRVLSAARELGYEPNTAARSLAMSKRRTCGLLICHSQFVYTDVFIMRVIEGMTLAVNRERIRLVVQPITLADANYLEIARRFDMDGVVLINTHDNDPGLEELIANEFPAVAMDLIPDLEIDQVYVDGYAASRSAVEHLVGLGHRRVAFITHAAPIYSAARERIRGYRDVLGEHGISVPDAYIQAGDFTEQSGYNATLNLLELAERPTAVFAGNDVIAYGAMEAIHEAGLSIPEDMSLIGFDDDYMSRYVNPPLSTVVIPAAGMGSTAVTLLAERIEGTSRAKPERRMLPSQIARRESCGPPLE